MSRRAVLLLAFLSPVVAGVAWLATRGADPLALAEVGTQHVVTPHAPAAAAPVELAVPAEPAPAQVASSERAVAPAVAAVETYPDDAQWVEGRVVFPTGTPRDERAFVVATGRKLGDATAHRFEVAPDGRFRAAFAAGTKAGTLKLDARYAFLPEPRRVDPRAAEPVVLEPALGGVVRVRVAPSAIAAARGVDFARAVVEASSFDLQTFGRPSGDSARCDASGVAEHTGLDPSRDWTFHLHARGLFAKDAAQARPRAGEVVAVDLAAVAATRVAGSVHDARGAPIPGATITPHAESQDPSASFALAASAVAAADDGAFELFLPVSGGFTLRIAKLGFRQSRVGPYVAAEGAEHAGLAITLGDGLAIEGSVRWPDGRPVEDATVELGVDAEWFAEGDREQSTRTGADGSFRFGGLIATARYSIGARARRADGGRFKSDRPWWSAFRAEVPAGMRDLVVELGPGASVRGHIVDDQGAPVANATVVAIPVDDEEDARVQVTVRVRDERGAFELAGLGDGEWRIGANLASGEPESTELLLVPRDAGRDLRLVLARRASIAGRVVDVDGQPAAGARISISAVGEFSSDEDHELRAGVDGSFRRDRIAPGRFEIQARSGDRAPSPKLLATLAPGTATSDLVLQLRRGGTIEGRVLDFEDRPWKECTVHVRPVGEWYGFTEAQTAPDGTYRLERVTPGNLEVSATSDDDAWTQTKVVALDDGGVVRVEFGGRISGRVLVRGSLRRDAPIEDARLEFHAYDASGRDVRTCRSDAAGRYEVQLAGPGRYSVQIEIDDGIRLDRDVVIPDAAEHALDFDLASGRIAGRVLDSEGRPVRHAQVTANPAEPSGSSSSALRSTSADGSFDLVGLAPGTYELSVEPGWAIDDRQRFAPRTVKGLQLEAEGNRTGLDIRVERAASLTVRIRTSSGAPAAQAAVFWTVSDTTRSDRADSSGIVVLSGLPPGEVAIRAATQDEVTREAVRATVTAGETAEAAILLAPGGRIRVKLLDAAGRNLSDRGDVPVGVLDAQGESAGLGGGPDADGSRSLGTFAPGTYTLFAMLQARKITRSITVVAGTTHDVVLREGS